MKIFTHKLILYDNGWCWRWEEKPPVKIFDTVQFICFIVTYGVAFSFFIK